MRKLLLYVLFITMLFYFAGCGATAKFVYPADAKEMLKLRNSDNPKYEAKVAVLPFDDYRDDENNASGWFLYLIPGFPWGEAVYERPDAARTFFSIREYDFDVREDLAKATATSLRHSGLFEDVFFTYGGDKSQADLVLEGKIQSTHYKGKVISYCLSVYGPLLWYVGLPGGESQNRLILELALKEQESKKNIWKYALDKEDKILQGLYYRLGHDCKGYSRIMQDGMNEAVQSLNNADLKIPKSEHR